MKLLMALLFLFALPSLAGSQNSFDLLKREGHTLDQELPRALRGNLTAMRNLAYLYMHGEGEGAPRDVSDPVLACAWRVAILLTGKEDVDNADIDYEVIACQFLTPEQSEEAARQSEQILNEIDQKK